MKAEELLDWIVAIIVILFIVIPFLASIFTKKKAPIRKEEVRQNKKQHRKKMIQHPEPKITLPLKQVMPKKVTAQKKAFKYGSLKQAVILSEILKRPYSED